MECGGRVLGCGRGGGDLYLQKAQRQRMGDGAQESGWKRPVWGLRWDRRQGKFMGWEVRGFLEEVLV